VAQIVKADETFVSMEIGFFGGDRIPGQRMVSRRRSATLGLAQCKVSFPALSASLWTAFSFGVQSKWIGNLHSIV